MLLFLAPPPGNYDGTGAPSVNYGWVLPNSSTTAEFSAACWFFAQELTDIAVDKNTTAPVIGLIQVRTDKRTLPSTPPKCGQFHFHVHPGHGQLHVKMILRPQKQKSTTNFYSKATLCHLFALARARVLFAVALTASLCIACC